MSTFRLGGTDEAYLLLESTVGVVAPMQVAVVLDDDPGPDVARDLVDRLVGGPLDRAVRRPTVPGARPSWVRPTGAASTRVDATPVDDAVAWAQRHLVEAPVDVVGARGWQVATVALTTGGRAVSVVASHVLADGRRFVQTVADAVAGLDRAAPVDVSCAPDEPGWVRRVIADSADAAAAVVDAVRAADALRRTPSAAPKPASTRTAPTRSGAVDGPPTHHVVTLDLARWRAAAHEHGGTATTLLAAVGAGLARHSGVVAARGGADGPVRVTLAVDRRGEGDSTTANTAGGVAVTVSDDPTPDTGLAVLRSTIRAALRDPAGDDAVARIARLLPARVLRRVVTSLPGPDVSVSHLGPAPEALLTWRRARAQTVLVRAAARSAAPHLARRMLPGIALWGVEHGDAVTVTVCAVDPVARDDIASVVERELGRWGLLLDVRSG